MKTKGFRGLLTVAAAASVMALNAQTYGEQPTYPGRANYGALRFSQSSAWHSYLMLDLHRKTAARAEALNKAFSSKKEMLRYIDGVRDRLNKIAGELPERGELNSKVVGKVECDGYTIEKVIFQSSPGKYVTAHLYMPKGVTGKVPACIEMCGHGLRGKGESSISAIRMAVNGIAVMVVDPIAQGERLQLIDGNGNALTRGVTTEHTLLNPAYNLLGSSLAVQEYWDNSRAIDYLLTRSDIDGNNIGAYGFSGGGTQAAYLIALDERIKTGCVGLFFSSRERTLEIQGPSDGCQQIPYEGKESIEIADMIMMMAPKPFIVLDGKYDFVDHWGALNAFDELKRCYTLLGKPDNVEQYYAEDGHAMPLDVQIKLVNWFINGLSAKHTGELSDAKTPDLKGADMRCTKSGQVNLEYADALSVQQETLQGMDELSGERKAFLAKNKTEISNTLLSLLGLDGGFNDNIEFVPTGRSSLREVEEYRFQINCEGQMPVPCVVWVPANLKENSEVEIHLHEQGKAWFLNDQSKRDAVSSGNIIIAADFRGIGELEDPYIYNYTKYWNKDYRTSATAMHIGRPLIGQRVADMRTLLNFCDTNELVMGRKITVIADGVYGPVVMHAAVLDNRISAARLSNCLKTWRSYLENPLQHDMYANILYGVLRYYDLPDLVNLSEGRVKVID
jgi:hypothetical protein